MKYLSVIFLCLLSGFGASAQTQTPFRQFYFNPYQFNPGYLGISGFTEINVSYRQQWIGIEDSPTSQGLTLQLPMKSRIGLGLMVTSQEAVLLRHTRAMVSFNYAVPLGIDHSLRFGLSGGVVMNNLSLKAGEYDPNDPTIVNAAPTNYGSDGNFGIVYRYKGLKIGFAFTQLFQNKSFSKTTFDDIRVAPLENRLYSASYRFNFGPNIAFEPYFLYRQLEDKTDNWEGAGVLHIKNTVWLGGSYHETNGIGLLAGLSISDRFRVGYSYELPPQNSNFINTTSHELQVGIRLGKNKHPIVARHETVEDTRPVSKAVPAEEEPLPVETPKQNNVAEASKLEQEQLPETTDNIPAVTQNDLPRPSNQEVVVKEPAAQTSEPVREIVREQPDKDTEHVREGKPPLDFTLKPGHYLVIGVFRLLDNAMKYALEIQSKGLASPAVALNPKNGYYCVYSFSTYDLDEARKERTRYRLKRPFAEAWILTIE